MCKSEIFATIMKVVSTETEVSESLILSDCKSTDTVELDIYWCIFSHRADYIHLLSPPIYTKLIDR